MFGCERGEDLPLGGEAPGGVAVGERRPRQFDRDAVGEVPSSRSAR